MHSYFDKATLVAKLKLTMVVSQAEAAPRSVFELAELAFEGGVTALQLREKHLGDRDFYDLAKKLADFCRERGKAFIVNDRLDLALAVRADGVHLGQKDLPARVASQIMVAKGLGPKPILGVSVSTVMEAMAAKEARADYLGVGPMVNTLSKVGAQVVDSGQVRPILSTGLVTVAIGGIGPNNAADYWTKGFNCLAAISAFTKSADPAQTARDMMVGAPKSIGW
ncbi:MAG: thiamine phosphate synthase [Deltaproteobacteria bacterium]|jgi:thiamine-phosphate pyrophosphorylase|nr:thiamine phosphate synthase [Deltaproteobacteria bacterium]